MGFPVLDVTSWESRGHEQVGLTEHPWLGEPVGSELYLWKPAQLQRLERREHVAEKIAAALAQLVGVPCAAVELAVRHGVPGCLSRNVQPHGWDRAFGADLLLDLDPAFNPTDRRHVAYTVHNIHLVLADVASPLAPTIAELEGWSAFDVFAGYLAFDALILNKDRHARNWAVLRPRQGGRSRLCGLYDNASSLGLSLSDTRAANIAASRGAEAYVRKASAARAFARREGRDSTLFEVAADALSLCSPQAREHWLGQVEMLTVADIGSVVAACPDLSDALRTLVPQLVMSARRRILDAV